MAQWPATLPGIRLPVSSARQSSLIRTEMDTGPAKVRRRYSGSLLHVQFTMQTTGTQHATLDTFYETTLVGGSLAFEMTDPVSGETENFRFLEPPTSTVVRGGAVADRILDVNIRLERLP